MKIGLIDVDGHNFPNLALMKLSAWHKAQGDTVEWVNYFENYDVVYKSKVFTFTKEDNTCINAGRIIKAGTGYRDYTTVLPEEIEHTCPDYSLYPQYKEAYGFLTRGCPNKCPWCIVPSKEGVIRPHADITEFIAGRKRAVLIDNNVLASDWGLSQIEKIVDLGIRVDFNQGLDARIVAGNTDIARLLARVKWLKQIRFACDTKSQIPVIEKTVRTLSDNGIKPSKIFVYVLIKQDTEDALERLHFLKSLGVAPFAQPYRDFEGKVTITREQRRIARWCNHKAIFQTVDYAEYNNRLRA